MRTWLEETLAKHTGRSIETVENDIERDKILSAESAKEYGLIDEVLAQPQGLARLLSAGATAAASRQDRRAAAMAAVAPGGDDTTVTVAVARGVLSALGGTPVTRRRHRRSMRVCAGGPRYRLGTGTGHGARAGNAVRAAGRPVSAGTNPDGRGHRLRTAPARPTHNDSESSPLRADQLEGSPRGTHRRRRRPAEVLVLRQEPEAGQEAHRRSGCLHLRRVHRPVQRDHRGGARRDLRAGAGRAAQAARDLRLPRAVRHRPGPRQAGAGRRGLQPLQAHPGR